MIHARGEVQKKRKRKQGQRVGTVPRLDLGSSLSLVGPICSADSDEGCRVRPIH